MNHTELAAGVRTVMHMAGHFEGLKQAARTLAEQSGAQQRGYFTTTEEDDTRAILVSYWKSRNALFDLILSIRVNVQEDDEDYPDAFLIAFSASLLLVDAARFLREIVESKPLVRQKLNEPAPQFGVPGGVYDTIQRSLVGARQGWHLYHALSYYHEQEPSLRQLTTGNDFEPLMKIVDRLINRLEISPTQFAQVRLRVRTDQLMRRMARNLFGRALYGLQKLAGTLVADKYVRPGHLPGLPAPIVHQLNSLICPGDVLIVRKEYALTNYFLPGYWPHAALVLGSCTSLEQLGVRENESVQSRWNVLAGAGQDAVHVLESMRDGVQIRSLASPFASDSVVVIRPKLNPQQIAIGLSRCLAHEGKPYDFDFDFRRSDRLVCTEVIYRAYDGLGSVHLPLISRAGRPTLSGSDLIGMTCRGEQFAPVGVFAPAWNKEVLRGQDVVPILNAGEGN